MRPFNGMIYTPSLKFIILTCRWNQIDPPADLDTHTCTTLVARTQGSWKCWAHMPHTATTVAADNRRGRRSSEMLSFAPLFCINVRIILFCHSFGFHRRGIRSPNNRRTDKRRRGMFFFRSHSVSSFVRSFVLTIRSKWKQCEAREWSVKYSPNRINNYIVEKLYMQELDEFRIYTLRSDEWALSSLRVHAVCVRLAYRISTSPC